MFVIRNILLKLFPRTSYFILFLRDKFYRNIMHKSYCKLLLFKSLAFIIILFIFSGCSAQKKSATHPACSTKYPIVFVHGVAYRDDVPIIKYWSRLPKILEKNGAKVFLSNQNAFNSHVENALQLRERILEILEQSGSEKVNIIAHSKGGLESRYMISNLAMADRVASLTTLASPHRGSYIADTLINWLTEKQWLNYVVHAANKYARIIGDKNPDALAAAQNLTVGYMDNFNHSVPDMPQVYYQSFGGIVSNSYPVWMVRFQHKILSEKEGENDGIVSYKSYQWANFKGVVQSNQEFGVSHFDIAGMKFVSKQSTFDAMEFIIQIAKDLKERGF